jgi:hypothetical protein
LACSAVCRLRARHFDPQQLNELELGVPAAMRRRLDARYGFEFLTFSTEHRQHIQAATRILATALEKTKSRQIHNILTNLGKPLNCNAAGRVELHHCSFPYTTVVRF